MKENSLEAKFTSVQEGTHLEDYRGRPGNILVIAPHPDDDVLGAGGSMAASAGEGKGVFSVYMTDGRASPRLDKSITDEQIAHQREKEALNALKAVGATGGFFLRKHSGELEEGGGEKVETALAEILQLLRPREVFLPAPYERHFTHQRCTRLAVQALRSVKGEKPILLGYSLWGSFWGGKRREVRDISPFIRKKIEAVLAHSSQVAYKNYQQGILGKNNYEAIFWESHEVQKATFAEIFLDMNELLATVDLTLETFIRQDAETFLDAFVRAAVNPAGA